MMRAMMAEMCERIERVLGLPWVGEVIAFTAGVQGSLEVNNWVQNLEERSTKGRGASGKAYQLYYQVISGTMSLHVLCAGSIGSQSVAGTAQG